MLHYMDMEEALYTAVKLDLSPIDISSDETQKDLIIVSPGYDLGFGRIGSYPTQFHVHNDILRSWMFWVETDKLLPLWFFIESIVQLG